MTSNFRFRLFFTLCISLLFALDIHKRHHAHPNREDMEDNQLIYAPYLSGILLPLCLSITFILVFLMNGFETASENMLSMWFGDFIHIGIYYMLLLPILPFLRRYISARACAVLWIIPNYLYLAHRNLMELSMPRFIIHAPETLIWSGFYIWIIGFIGIFSWKVFSHLKFRYEILKDSVPVTELYILNIWNQELESANIKKPKFRLVISPRVSTPISIGLFKRTIRVLLPERDYTAEDLSLIFRHELVHISREDSCTKFFLTFCTAMFWFNPFMWITMRKCSDDLELSCDETVLLECDDTTRRRYAELILNTAGEERGFTTCLSASAKALRYRLQNIMKPKKRHSGAITVGLVFFILCMSCGYVALAYDSGTGSEIIFQTRNPELYTLNHIAATDDPYQTTYQCIDTDAFHEYLSGLTLHQITGNYSFNDYEKQFTFIYDTPEGVLSIVLSDNTLKVVPLYGDRNISYYYLPDGVDWDYLDTLIFSYPALNVHANVSRSNTNFTKKLSASLWSLKRTENGETTVLHERNPLEGSSGFFGYEATEVTLDFSHVPASAYTVKIESWDRQSGYTISQTDLEQADVLPLAEYPAHYTIYATFSEKDGSTYEAEFRFDFGDVDSN